VEYVRTKSGKQYMADYYISDVHPCTLMKLMDEKAFPKSYRERLDTIPNTHSAFALYVKLKQETFPYINHSEYYMTRYADVWNFSRTDRPWPLGFLMMTPPNSHQGQYATKVLITAPMPFDMVRQWKNTTVGHRGAEYEAWKAKCAELLLAQIEEMHPGFQACIEAINTSSPLTIRDFYGVKDGSICGFAKNCQNIVLSQVPVVTKVRNLLLTGQNVNLHGFCGVPLTAITTCEAILGRNYVVNKINET
jgi:all-trans-retinol 13,14-reductase